MREPSFICHNRQRPRKAFGFPGTSYSIQHSKQHQKKIPSVAFISINSIALYNIINSTTGKLLLRSFHFYFNGHIHALYCSVNHLVQHYAKKTLERFSIECRKCVCFGFALLHYVIGQENSCHFFNQWKQNHNQSRLARAYSPRFTTVTWGSPIPLCKIHSRKILRLFTRHG